MSFPLAVRGVLAEHLDRSAMHDAPVLRWRLLERAFATYDDPAAGATAKDWIEGYLVFKRLKPAFNAALLRHGFRAQRGPVGDRPRSSRNPTWFATAVPGRASQRTIQQQEQILFPCARSPTAFRQGRNGLASGSDNDWPEFAWQKYGQTRVPSR